MADFRKASFGVVAAAILACTPARAQAPVEFPDLGRISPLFNLEDMQACARNWDNPAMSGIRIEGNASIVESLTDNTRCTKTTSVSTGVIDRCTYVNGYVFPQISVFNSNPTSVVLPNFRASSFGPRKNAYDLIEIPNALAGDENYNVTKIYLSSEPGKMDVVGVTVKRQSPGSESEVAIENYQWTKEALREKDLVPKLRVLCVGGPGA